MTDEEQFKMFLKNKLRLNLGIITYAQGYAHRPFGGNGNR